MISLTLVHIPNAYFGSKFFRFSCSEKMPLAGVLCGGKAFGKNIENIPFK